MNGVANIFMHNGTAICQQVKICESAAMSKAKKTLFNIESPLFDGIGLLRSEAVKRGALGEKVYILDSIRARPSPTDSSHSIAAIMLWKIVRVRQFKAATNVDRYYELCELIDRCAHQQEGSVPEIDAIITEIADNFLRGNGYSPAAVAKNMPRLCLRLTNELYKEYFACESLIQNEEIDEIVVFNGRGYVSKLLEKIARKFSVRYTYLEYFGYRDSKVTYIACSENLFDLDLLSDWVKREYDKCTDSEKEVKAVRCLEERFHTRDPQLTAWGVRNGKSFERRASEKTVVGYFPSSEDEYPVIAPSKHGLRSVTKQYEAFGEFCDEIIKQGWREKTHIIFKLHPRYAIFGKRMGYHVAEWMKVLDTVRKSGVSIEVADPQALVHELIRAADLVMAYGTVAWEATYLGKTAILLGPTAFGTHGCCYEVREIRMAVDFLKAIRQPKERRTCYPYAWGWKELGQEPLGFRQFTSAKTVFGRLQQVFANRFDAIESSRIREVNKFPAG